MDLHTLLSTIAHTYNRDRELDQQSPAAKQLRACENVLCRYVPPGYVIKGSSGQGTRAAVPWIGVFDPDETTSATRGMYVVYLFSADMRNIFLTLLQGSEDLRKELKGSPARIKLSRQAEVIREHIVPNLVEDLDDHVSLQAPSSIERPKYYEAGTIVAKKYDARNLPIDADLRADLSRFIHLCHHAIDCRRQLTLAEPDLIATREPYRPPAITGEFKPKDDSDYQQLLTAKTITKSRKHEKLLKEFNEHLRAQGFSTASPHPRDMVAARGEDEWLIEAKTLQYGNGMQATREALAQLLWYRYCHYTNPSAISMLALFNEPIGELCVEVLKANNIDSVWPGEVGWVGTLGAAAAGFCSNHHVSEQHGDKRPSANLPKPGESLTPAD